MNSRCVRVVAAIVVLLLFTFSGFAQQGAKDKYKAASLDGTTGLFKTWDAETLRRGETNWTFGYDQYNRDPGQLTIGRAPVGVAIGIFDRLEFYAAMDVTRHITADNIRTYRRASGSPPLPATSPFGQSPYFTQAAPFMDVPVATDRGDFHLGLKFNALSEFRGKPVSLGFAGFGTLPGQKDAIALSRGLSSGAYQGGFAMLLSKTASNSFRIHMNVGTNFYENAELSDVEFQNEFIYRGGVEFPTKKPYRVIAELSGIKYYGNESTGINPKSPLDVILGMRVYPKQWMSVGAGYQATINHVGENRQTGALSAGYHGFVIQGTVGTRRDDPPTVSCAAAKDSILQQDTTTIRATAVDPEDDVLTYAWNASGGKVSGNNDTATFDATNVAPGKYTVTATVKDRKHEVSCSSDITVLKRNYAPTASVEPSSFNVVQGESVNLRCVAADQNNDPLTYAWTVDGQKLAAEGPQITFGTEGRKPGAYEVTCTASDGEASASAASKGNIRERIIPNQPPTTECLTTTVDVASGGSIELRAKASDPDGDKLNYSWTSSGGSVSGAGETATFNAAGVNAGSYTVTVTVDDGRGGKASCSMTVNVSERLSVTKEKCGYFAPGGARVDNCAKAILDDLAVRMKNDPKLRANVIGYTDSREGKKLGEKRAKAVAAYLEKQGVESSRMTITNGGVNNPVGDNKKTSGRKLNRRVEIELSVH
jgi:outer membrane protein OmpA-like peptidoglycan-associated protein